MLNVLLWIAIGLMLLNIPASFHAVGKRRTRNDGASTAVISALLAMLMLAAVLKG